MSSISSLIGDATAQGPASPSQYNTFQPQYGSQADSSFYNTVQNNLASNPYQQNQPAYAQYLNASLNNPYQAGAQTAANTAGANYGTASTAATGDASTLNTAGQNLLSAGQQVYNTAFDPQNALYARTQQQLQDQVNAGQASRGITMSGYGADLSNQANSNFNIDWQNNQLSRQTQGLSALASANSGANSDFSNANALGTSGANSALLSGAIPNSEYSSGLNTDFNALSNYGSQVGGASQALTNSSLSQLMSYLGLTANQSNAQGSFDQQYYDDLNGYISAQNQQNAALYQGIGNVLQNGVGGSGGYSNAASLAGQYYGSAFA